MIYLLDFFTDYSCLALKQALLCGKCMYLQFGISFPRKIILFEAFGVLSLSSVFTSYVTDLLGMHLASSNNNGINKKGVYFPQVMRNLEVQIVAGFGVMFSEVRTGISDSLSFFLEQHGCFSMRHHIHVAGREKGKDRNSTPVCLYLCIYRVRQILY